MTVKMPTFSITRKMETRRLQDSEIKKIVSVLQDGATKADIRALPRRLRSTFLTSSSSSKLCSEHKDLDPNLLKELWSWVKYEFQSGVGKHVLPVLMAGKLTITQERDIRQLEPVLQMWRKGFRTQSSAPPDRQPLLVGSKWSYQWDQCPACMLSRIGSDQTVLCALYAGMVARFSIHKLVSHKLTLAELDASKLNHPRSKRVRFIRYWIKASRNGKEAAHDAAELGIAIKKMHEELLDDNTLEIPNVYGRASRGDDPFHDNHRVSEDTVRPRTAEHRSSRPSSVRSRKPSVRSTFHDGRRASKDTVRPRTSEYRPQRQPSAYAPSSVYSQPQDLDLKLGPQPRPSTLTPRTPLENVGIRQSRRNDQESLHPYRSPAHAVSNDTIAPDDSITRRAKPHPNSRRNTNPSSPTIVNLPALPKRTKPVRNDFLSPHSQESYAPSAAPAPLAPKKARPVSPASSFTTILSYDGPSGPVPSRNPGRLSKAMYSLSGPQVESVYGGFGNFAADPYEIADEDVIEEVDEEEEEVVVGAKSTVTEWGKLY